MKLTDTACRNTKPKDKSYKMFDGGGLYMEVMPNFLFSFEADWTGKNLQSLTDRTYLHWMSWKREQPGHGVSFDPALEPLAEVCRLAFYEIACKISALNHHRFRTDLDSQDIYAIETWFEALWPFAVSVLEAFTEKFARGRMSLDTLPQDVAVLYDMIAYLNKVLPPNLRNFHVLNGHGDRLMTREGWSQAEDHGWDKVIPGGPE